jgi:hypothetical protein
MFELHVWVPTKGWKPARRFKTEQNAVEMAREFEPLEVKVSSKNGRTYYGGSYCTVDHSIPPVENTLPVYA